MTAFNTDARSARNPVEVLSARTSRNEVIKLALGIADEWARFLIENSGYTVLQPNELLVGAVARALRYIELRGDALPYRVIRDGNLIRFEDKP